MNGDRPYALLRGLLLGLAAFALLAHALLLGGAAVPGWLLPLCALAGCAAASSLRTKALAAPAPLAVRGPRWLVPATVASVLAVAAVLAYGALATPPRDWDGVVAWGVKAQALAAAPTLLQPLFADPAVFHHSPDYPLLQPLCVAACGGALFPLLYLALVALVGFATGRRTGDLPLACAAALGIALLPELVATGGGGVDSGYAETFHALALAAVAAALLLDDALLLGAAAVLLPFVKPEGTVHAVAVAAAVLAWGPLRLAIPAVLGAAAALAVWLPLQLLLAHAPPSGPTLPLGVVAAAVVALLLRRALRGLRLPRRSAWLLGAGAVAAAATLLVLAQPLFAGSRTVLLSHYLGDLERAVPKLAATPQILGGLLATALSPRRFGALFALALALLAVAAFERRRGVEGAGDPAGAPLPGALLAVLGLAFAAVVAAFYLSPEADVRHHLRSSAGRLLLQTSGALWLAVAAALAPRLAAAALPAWLATALGRAAR